jgi:hypothetical protein
MRNEANISKILRGPFILPHLLCKEVVIARGKKRILDPKVDLFDDVKIH